MNGIRSAEREDIVGSTRQLSGDRAAEAWLRGSVAPAYDALRADPSRAVSADHVRLALAKANEKAVAKRR
ncbi:hypothetical protein SAMN05421819_4338 [Bryocella elongata]|uniref:Uncharacterized protein n=1 Tax=Bryocella elongata TaxID=863522 RepID=A0A1H6C8V4_9BACT|nr:type II toxin-antitoxin system ParD family antitoxin [Bryocella elongata]SEG69338.1 hypothetical protein SAMN05421819_4338 [Bryocella elongata]